MVTSGGMWKNQPICATSSVAVPNIIFTGLLIMSAWDNNNAGIWNNIGIMEHLSMESMENDRLAEIFKIQAQLESYFHSSFDAMILPEKAKWTKEHCLAIMRELAELLDATPYSKYWKTTQPQLDMENIHEEIVDILHFTIALALLWNMNPQRLVEVYVKKSKENIRRYNSGY